MSFKIAQYLAPLKVDFINQSNVLGASPTYMTFTYPSTYNTNITSVNSSTFRIFSGSSYYLECSMSATNFNANGAVQWQFYNSTNSTLIGSQAQSNFVGGLGSVARVGRRVCSALILDSDISVSQDIRVAVTYSGSNWNFYEYTYVGHIGYPTVRIMQLPS